ncbi:P-type conjugative transfer protein TrbL [Methylovorus glucosotrophus]|uniref:P-type conjugative transfer protein TrbL n=1 Tax=Methylovorus glucosotrophus (strain SIP3-4) TaxID=582744 RepID=C6XES0_METGS|nr:P-type conjugative transfer protein TrbL [Methylovorus glucosotrophus]ACT52127.1 P-type conjugative transfer protein TrbL [Methylovorus glucosotrophus SIP3-4]
MSRITQHLSIKIFIVVLWTMFPTYGFSAGDLGEVLSQYKTSSMTFYGALQGFALSLLLKLWMVEMSWASIKWVLERKPFEDLLSHFVSASFPPLFFVLVIKMGNTWFPTILESFEFFGTKGSGLSADSASLDPGVILEKGIILQNQMVQKFNTIAGTGPIEALQNILPSLLLMAVCIIILIAFALMAANVFLVWAEAYLLIGVSPILLAFAGMRWTRDMAPKTFNSMIAAGIKILVLMLLMSIFTQLVPKWATEAASWTMQDWSPLWRVAFSAAGCAFFAWKAPQIAANAISGTSSLTAGDALQIAAMAATAAVGGAALAAGAADKVLNGASEALTKGGGAVSNGLMSMGGPSIEPITSSAVIPDPTGPSPISDGSTATTSNSPQGNASGATISGTDGQNIEKMFDNFASQIKPKPTLSEKIQGGVRAFQSTVPNDQASVGGDAVKMKE